MGPETEFDVTTYYGPGNHGGINYDASASNAIIMEVPAGDYENLIIELPGRRKILGCYWKIHV